MYFRQILDYYSREDVQKKMMEAANGRGGGSPYAREVVGVFESGAYGQRPSSLQYPGDITSMVRNGSIEFHCSIERWSQPMALKTDNYGQLRTGWDFVVDLDCNDFRHGRAAAVVLCKALEEHGIRNYSVKFTGGTGFHIGMPWENMPKRIDYKPSVSMFPELPKAMCLYIREYCREPLEKALLGLDSAENLAKQADVKPGELLTKDGINPFKLVDVDPVLISPRHLFRMPYSLNRKRMLASVPVRPSELGSFEGHQAEPNKLRALLGFLENGEEGEANALVAEASDWLRKNRRKFTAVPKGVIKFDKAVDPEHFPPCIKKMMEGLQDGRKRSLFILTNFLSSAGWKWEAIGNALAEWNSKNMPPLPENYIRTHLRWSSNRTEAQGRSILPPGCRNEGWYESIGVCFPDDMCGGMEKTVKNPVNYPARKLKIAGRKPIPKGGGKRKDK